MATGAVWPTLWLIGIALLFVLRDVRGYPRFQQEIPNGDHVPHPCKPNYIFHGVGHKNTLGGGVRNPFGRHFEENNNKWTKDLCRMDSDGDKKSNGEELGDPDCEWVANDGQLPERTTDITHPGICEPWNSTDCKARNTWVTCDTEQLECDVLKDEDVRNLTLTYPRTNVPANETTYACMIFDVPADEDYHLVATKPEIDNRDMMHHVVLFGCEDAGGKLQTSTAPFTCLMGDSIGCFQTISIWSVGSAGRCEHPETGFRFGKTSYKKVLLQYHWNNPEKRSDYFDASGFTLYYTPKLRKYDAGFLAVGQIYLEIPPRQPKVEFEAKCSSSCTTKTMKKPIYITNALNHMHYLGTQQLLEVRRNGRTRAELANDEVYSYDSPVYHTFKEPIEVLPGDEIYTRCTFNSKYATRTTFYGEGTQDEMCFGFVTYYPREAMIQRSCYYWKTMELCNVENEPWIYEGCNLNDFFNVSNTAVQSMWKDVTDQCDDVSSTCSTKCMQAVCKTKAHPCMKDVVGEFNLAGMARFAPDFSRRMSLAMEKCDCSAHVGSASCPGAALVSLVFLVFLVLTM